MSESKKHPSLEPVDMSKGDMGMTQVFMVSRDEPITESIVSLEKQHETNQAEIKKLTEIKTLLETDEADITTLRHEVLDLIRQRLLKK